MVVDGSGSPAYEADVGIRGDRIERISREPLLPESADRVIDASGQVVAPGFIDLHTHLESLEEMPEGQNILRQGVTTSLGGPDGTSPWPIGDYLGKVEQLGVGPNVAFQIGHNTVRREAMGMEDREPTGAELERMKSMVAQALREGAWGLSTGLAYIPGAFAQTHEIVELAEVAADSGAIYTSHLRDEALQLISSVAEAIEIARRADIPVVITHHKVVGQPMWGASTRTLAMVDSARAAGADVMMDQYPYTASQTGFQILVPDWALEGGDSAFLARARDPAQRERIISEIADILRTERGGGDLSRVQFANAPWRTDLEGRTLADWAEERGLEPTMEVGAELVIEALASGPTRGIYHVMHDDDVDRIMRHPQTMIASDGPLARPGDGSPHPRSYGTFPRVLGQYVREKGVLSLEEAVRKMTSMPADRLGLADRGRLTEGDFADIVIFDPETVRDRATFQDPHQYPIGIGFVLVNGEIAVEHGEFIDARAGRVLRRGRD